MPSQLAARSLCHLGDSTLSGKVVLINASDTRLAAVVACQLSTEGARITLCNIPRNADASVIPRALGVLGSECRVIDDRCDDRGACRQLVEEVVASQGAVDILINCGTADCSQEDDAIEGIEAVFRASLFPYFYLMAAVLPYLPEGGSIINSSTLHRRTDLTPDQAAAERAIIALTESFAATASRRGIRVNAVSRSSMVSPRGHHSFSGVDGVSHTSAFFPGSAWLFLASSASSEISGKTFATNMDPLHEAA